MLPQKVANSIELWRVRADKHHIVDTLINKRNEGVKTPFEYINCLLDYIGHDNEKLDLIAQAVYVPSCYQVEQTGEEKVKEMYEYHRHEAIAANSLSSEFTINKAKANAIIRTLYLLDIKIEGIPYKGE